MYEGRSKVLMEEVYAVKGESGFCRMLIQKWMLAPRSQSGICTPQTTEEAKIDFRAPVIPNHCDTASAVHLDLTAHVICSLCQKTEEGIPSRWGDAVGEDIDAWHLFNSWPERRLCCGLYRPGMRRNPCSKSQGALRLDHESVRRGTCRRVDVGDRCRRDLPRCIQTALFRFWYLETVYQYFRLMGSRRQ